MSNEYSLHQASAEYRAFDLPSPDTKRWVTRRKAVIVSAVRAGVISLEEVCRRYELSVEEFLAWQGAIDTHGEPGLRVTRLQIYRDNPPSRAGKDPLLSRAGSTDRRTSEFFNFRSPNNTSAGMPYRHVPAKNLAE
jgi:hypothetical protein